MAYKLKFDTGETVSFENQPTDADVEEVVKKLGIKPKNSTILEAPVVKQKGVLEKFGDVSGKVLEAASKFTGIKSAIDLGLTAGKGFAYGTERLLGKSSEEALKTVGKQPSTEIEKITAEKGLGAGIKNIAGKSIQAGASVAGLKGVGVIGSLGQKILTNIGLGGLISGGEAIAKNQDLKDVGKNVALGGVVGGAIPIVGAGLNAIRKQISLLPARFINSALSRNKADILKDIANDKVDDFAKYVIQKKPIGTANNLLNQSHSNIDNLSEQINSSLESAVRKTGIKKTIGINNFFDQITKLPEAEGALLKRTDVKGIVEKLAPQTKKLLSQQSLTIPEANKLRQLVDKTLGDRAFLGGQLSSDKIILKTFANNLRELVKEKAPEGTRALFSELTNEIRFRDGLLNRIARKAGNQVLSFGDFIGGGLGGIFGGGIGGAITGVATRRERV